MLTAEVILNISSLSLRVLQQRFNKWFNTN